MYMIDKVVRMRGQDGRFGIDHSELLNFELHKTNKERDDHMNWLVYKHIPPTEYDLVGNASASTLGGTEDNIDLNNSTNNIGYNQDVKMSAILFNKLNPKKAELHKDQSDMSFSTETDGP